MTESGGAGAPEPGSSAPAPAPDGAAPGVPAAEGTAFGEGVVLVAAGPVTTLVLDRPRRRGALDTPALRALRAAVDELARRVAAGEVRAAVVTGTGTAFCAGRDVVGVDPAAEDAGDVLEHLVNPVVAALAALPVPTVAAVEGPALGIGLGLALACDLVVAAEGAVLGSPFGRIGAVLDSGAHRFLVDRVGAARTLDLVYTGRLLDGGQAHAWGVADRVVATGTAREQAEVLAAILAQGPTAAFAASKALVARIRDEDLSLADVLEAEAAAQRAAGRGHDYREGFAAFTAKRAPRFTGR